MTRELALILMIALAVVLLALGVVAWMRRTRRDAGLAAPVAEIPAGATVASVTAGFYVATTPRDQPLERLAITGIAFRARVDVTVTDAGVALDLTGQPRLFLALDRIDGVDLARVAIDRVVEPGGLVRLSWRIAGRDGADVAVDSYLRPQDGSARALADAIAAILPTTDAAASAPIEPTASTTGPDA